MDAAHSSWMFCSFFQFFSLHVCFWDCSSISFLSSIQSLEKPERQRGHPFLSSLIILWVESKCITHLFLNGFPVLENFFKRYVTWDFLGHFEMNLFVISAPCSVWWQCVWFSRPHLGSSERHREVWHRAAFVCLRQHCPGEDAVFCQSHHPEGLLHVPANSLYHS